ncbi:hypothetical protein ARC63_06815 [Stenotrophomonas geniculata ATCC 19374 = JCM 13324]|nr:hypothetical protein ARC63_06815 [Stenotrophomonas geniculata ATCC 19374 = JCM 13324]
MLTDGFLDVTRRSTQKLAGYGGASGNVPSGRLPTGIRVLPFAAAVVGCVLLALVTGDPAAALMRSVVEFADSSTPNFVRFTGRPIVA